MQSDFRILLITAAIAALWWWIQRPLLARKWVYAATLGGVAVTLGAAFYLPHEWFELRYACVLQGMLLFDVCLVMLPFEGVNEPRCRRAARLASLPARSLGEARLPCAMHAEAMARAMTSRLTNPEPVGEGGVVADYMDNSRYLEVALYPQSEGCWVLMLWSKRDVELRDSEVAAICKQHQLTATPDFVGRGADALCLWRNGTLYIYPAAAQGDVEPLLRALNPVA